MERTRTTATTDFVVDEGSCQQRLERPRSARRSSQRPSVYVGPVESCVSPSLSTTSTIDDNDDDDEDFPPVLGDPVPPPGSLHALQVCPASPIDNRMLMSNAVDRRSRSSSRSPTSTTTASGGGLCLANLAEARQRVLDRYDRKQRPPSSVNRCQNSEDDVRRSMPAAGVDDFGVHRRRQQRLEPLTTVNGQASSTFSVQHHR